MDGAQVIVQTLLDEGVNTVFGYPGGAVLPIFDALYQKRDSIRHILTCHEQGAVHAADGYARASGRAGVIIATSGPGATNLVTGMATAYMDSSPLVAITGNVPLPLLGRDSFQEIDIAGVTMPITKHNVIVKSPGELAPKLHEAFIIARAGRPGPVLVDIPRDIAEAQYEDHDNRPIYTPPQYPADEHGMTRFCQALTKASKPVILAGGGVVLSGAGQALQALAERLGAPVCTTLMGLGALPWDHPLFLGMVGLHGLDEANRALGACDLLLAVGTRFTERVVLDRRTFAPQAEIYHIDIDPAEMGKNITPVGQLIGDADSMLKMLSERVEPKSGGWSGQFVSFADRPLPLPGTPHSLIRAIWRHRTPGMTVVTDVGQHQMWAAQAYGVESPRRFITSGGLGAMGFGLGAALGTCMARSGERTVLVTGDASFHMNMAELATAVRYQLPITIFVFDNESLGLVRQLQDTYCQGRHSAVAHGWRTDYVKLAEAMGARGYMISLGADPEQTIKEALACDGPCVVHCPIDARQNA